MVIPDPSNSKRLIDVYLESLIEELQNLWHVGVLTRDSARDETFAMRTVLMWTVNDLPAYGMTEVAFQEDESIPTSEVLTDDHNYTLHDPNGIQLVVDLNQQGAGTSRAANGESDDEPDENSFDEDYDRFR
ncbi:UNVERIFIED_CONTAM: hypothetical protein Slati_3762200 [Sesamum latifolium]|uniref:Uncharacterized protein n=1 Tax=Sesamum latifolium TaxID=2727402 RepID=A0AAW2U408_9LAMI